MLKDPATPLRKGLEGEAEATPAVARPTMFS